MAAPNPVNANAQEHPRQEFTRHQVVNEVINQRYVHVKILRTSNTIHSVETVECFDKDGEVIDHADVWLTIGSPFQLAMEAKQVQDIPIFAIPFTQLGLLIDCGAHARQVRNVSVKMMVSDSQDNPQNYQIVEGYLDYPIQMLGGFPLVSFTPSQDQEQEQEQEDTDLTLPHISGHDYRYVHNGDINNILVAYDSDPLHIAINGEAEDLDIIPMPMYTDVSVSYEGHHTFYLEAIPQLLGQQNVNIMGTHIIVDEQRIWAADR